MSRTDSFARRFGPWAVVAGGSSGLGLAFGRALARRGLNLVLVARSRDVLEASANGLRQSFPVEVRTLRADLAEPDEVDRLLEACQDLEVGCYVHNAAASPIGPFLDTPWQAHERVLRLNCWATARAAWHFGRLMADRGRGGLVLVSSQASFQGTALVAHYAASKAYLRVLAEGLWAELGPRGVAVTAPCPGMVDTPALRSTTPDLKGWLGPGPADPDQVAEDSLQALERGEPSLVPGSRAARLSVWLTTRLFPRSWATRLVSAGTRRLYGRRARDQG